jgi:hypothetical protein
LLRVKINPKRPAAGVNLNDYAQALDHLSSR